MERFNIYFATWDFIKYGGGFKPYVCIDYPLNPKQGTMVLIGDSLEKDHMGNPEIIDYIQDKQAWMRPIIEKAGFCYDLFNPAILNSNIMYDPSTFMPARIQHTSNVWNKREYLETHFSNTSSLESIDSQIDRANDILNNKVETSYGRGKSLLAAMGSKSWKEGKDYGNSYYKNGGCYADTLKIKPKP